MTDGRLSMLVTADDSTGATEAGAACADVGLHVYVIPIGAVPAKVPHDSCVVIDLRSRHETADEARRRITATTTDVHRVHKIDSTLRGNWAAEASALVDSGRRVVMIPSHPLVGRVCAGGVVYVNGVPLAESEIGNDPRLPVRSSRPSETLAGDEIADADALAAWLATTNAGVAIVDAATLADIDRLVAMALRLPDVILVGPASVVAAVAVIRSPGGAATELPMPHLPTPIVAVCASLHPVSRAQIAKLVDAGIDVVTSSQVRTTESAAIVAEVAERGRRLVAAKRARSVILVGGDTAEAFIGDSVVRVFGSIGVGVSLGQAGIDGATLRLACKPGGFGAPNTLVDLVTS
ncbi:MAG: four-carbon acid sugar kinase family protein [Ilumatobacteraceae bacterium]